MLKHQATIKEIAAALNVSISTVSRALQNDPRIGLRTKMRVQEMAKVLHYTPNPAAVLLRKRKTYTIGVLLPWFREEFFSSAITGMEDVLALNHYHAMISQSRDIYEREKMAIQSFIAGRVDGVIASLAAETAHYEHFKELNEAGIPLVFFDRTPLHFPSHQVRSNVSNGVAECMHFLQKRQINRVAIINAPNSLNTAQERLEGFLRAAQGAGAHVPPEFIKCSNLSAEDNRRNMQELLDLPSPPQAVLAFNDYVALDAMQACKQRGFTPNKDIYFVSFANLPLTAYLDNPPIASVEQFAYEMGEQAARLILEVIEHESDLHAMEYREVILETKLIEHKI